MVPSLVEHTRREAELRKEAKGRPDLVDDTPVSEVMTRDVLCVSEDMTAGHVAQLFLERGISGAPVMNGEGRAVGVVSKTDLVREAYDKGAETNSGRKGLTPTQLRELPVSEFMTPLAYTLKPNSPLSQAAALMAFENIHRIPIVNDDGTEIVGLLSSLDVLRWIGEKSGYLATRSAS